MIYDREKILKPFIDNSFYMKSRTRDGIEAYRKGDAYLAIRNAAGEKVTGAKVNIRQKTHDFLFGANIFMLDELETEEKNDLYKKTFASLFNEATVPFYWKDLEPEEGKPRYAADSPKVYRRPAPDLCVDFCQKHGITPKLHCLTYDPFPPSWVPKDLQIMKRLLEKRYREIAERYGLSETNVSTILNRTRTRPRDFLRKEGYEL